MKRAGPNAPSHRHQVPSGEPCPNKPDIPSGSRPLPLRISGHREGAPSPDPRTIASGTSARTASRRPRTAADSNKAERCTESRDRTPPPKPPRPAQNEAPRVVWSLIADRGALRSPPTRRHPAAESAHDRGVGHERMPAMVRRVGLGVVYFSNYGGGPYAFGVAGRGRRCRRSVVGCGSGTATTRE